MFGPAMLPFVLGQPLVTRAMAKKGVDVEVARDDSDAWLWWPYVLQLAPVRDAGFEVRARQRRRRTSVCRANAHKVLDKMLCCVKERLEEREKSCGTVRILF